MVKLERLIDQLEAQVANSHLLNTGVSAAPISWHIEHSLLVIDLTLKGMKKSSPGDYRRNFSFWRLLTFSLGRFPRGRAKAPKAVEPKEGTDAQALTDHIGQTRQSLKEFLQLDPLQHMKHPIFGKLNLRQTLRFLELHTRHHMDIIGDIVKKPR